MMMMMWWWHTDNYHNAVGTGAGEDGDDADDDLDAMVGIGENADVGDAVALGSRNLLE